MELPSWKGLRSRWTAPPTPIGIDFDAERVHWVQLERAGHALRLRDACSVKHGGDLEALLDSKGDLKHLVSEVMQRSRFKGRKIVTSAPTGHLRLMVLNYTADEGSSEPEQILGLARERMRDDLRDHVVDFVRIRTSGEQQGERSALVAITPEEPVLEHLERLRRAGLEVEALEIAPVAIRRLVSASVISDKGPERSELVLVVRISGEKTELTLLTGRRLLLYRELDIGMTSLAQAVSKGLDCDLEAAGDLISSYGVGGYAFDEARPLEFAEGPGAPEGAGEIAGTLREILRPGLRSLVEQAHKAISYAAFQTRGTSIENVYLLQGNVPCPGLDGLLAEMLQLPVELFRPMSRFDGDHELVSAANEQRVAVALGFALRGLVDV